MVYSLTHAELNALYWGAGLDDYQAEAVLVKTDKGELAALCCNLLMPPDDSESNFEYEEKLRQSMKRLGVPVTFSS